MKNLYFLLVIFIYSVNNPLFSQEDKHNETTHEISEHQEHTESHHHKHAVSFVLSHTHLNNIGDDWVAVPSFGINYNYNINEKWAIGLHNDIIIEEIVIENEDEHEEIEKSMPVSSAIMISYEAMEHLVLMAGGGMEFSKHEDFTVIRFAIETPFHIPNNWEVLGVLSYDIGIDAYNSFNFGIGIAKLF
ncbi:MAG: hypothetical protein ABFR05_04640 [Bacteroidota bacterium]